MEEIKWLKDLSGLANAKEGKMADLRDALELASRALERVEAEDE